MLTLDEKFKQTFGISQVHDSWNGGQKNVFLVTRNGIKCILKSFTNFNTRDIRELEVYKKYSKLPGIPKIIETKSDKGSLVVFEEYINGKTLENIREEYKENYEKISKLITDICEILRPIWTDAIVHRDLKPSNIMVKADGSPIVIDFGIAKDFSNTTFTQTGFQPHTWQFAAPEQLFAEKEKISYRTDFFSLGVIVYFLYCGELPFGSTKEAVEENFRKRDLCSFAFIDGCKLNNFFTETLRFNPSERPNQVESFINLL